MAESTPEDRSAISAVLNAAFIRALVLGVIGGLAAFGGSLMMPDFKIAYAVGAAIGMFCTTFLARWALEGGYDANRAVNGTLSAGDVPEASAKLLVTRK